MNLANTRSPLSALRSPLSALRSRSARLPTSRSFVFAVGSVLWLLFAGCSNENKVAQKEEAATSTVPNLETLRSESSASVTLVQSHDFGLVRPRQVVTHRFPIHNPSRQNWTTRRIFNSCVCTVTQLTAERIAPGATEYAEVTYKAAEVTTDDRRQLQISFEEPGTPILTLGIQAQVRERLTTIPKELLLGLSNGAQPMQVHFEIQNFDDQDWSDVAAKPQAPWLAVSITPIRSTKDANPGRPRQRWRVDVKVDQRQLAPGSHVDLLELSAVGISEPVHKSVQVSLEVPQPIRVTPREFFLGSVSPGQSTSRVLLVLLQGDKKTDPANRMTIRHDLADEFQVTWGVARGEYWELRGEFSAASDRAGGLVEGTVSIEDKSGELPKLDVPLKVLVEKSSDVVPIGSR